ncbi:MAG: tetratricopeptide repeat protein [Deltaproteobacteria bacterium]|nr:tetratricopeptide repeat protein [Deltaproteobacteria bacterium]
MGQRRRLHAFVVAAVGVAIAVPVAIGQVRPGRPTPPTPTAVPPVPPPENNAGGDGSGSGSGPPPKAAGASSVESSDIPPWQPSPPRFAVAPFENQGGTTNMDWLVAGAPFEIALKTEEVLGLEPTGGTLYVGASPVANDADAVVAFAQQRDAPWVITGFADRPSNQLRISLTLWKVTLGNQRAAVVQAEASRTGEGKAYHQLLGEALGEVWRKANVPIDLARAARLQRPLANDLYAVTLFARGLGNLTGALGGVNLKAAEHDLERAVFIDPKCPEAQRLLGELYLLQSPGDARLMAKATGKFNYANDLRPDDLGSLRASAYGAVRAAKWEMARELFTKLVVRKPWDLDARYELGAAMWRTGNAAGAQRQLEQVTSRKPDHLAARRVLVLIHSSRNATDKLVSELEAIAQRAPGDLEVKGDLATAYGALGAWAKASAALEEVAAARAPDLAFAMRIGDARRRQGDLEGAIGWYARASKLDPGSSFPAFATAQAYVDANKLPEAIRWYTLAQKFTADVGAAEEALGAIGLLQNRPDDAAWYLRRAVRSAPRVIATWRAEVAAELRRKDTKYALLVLDRALAAWPNDPELNYLAAVAHAQSDEPVAARWYLTKALELRPGYAAALEAREALDQRTPVALSFTPEIVRPWGDAEAIEAALDRYAGVAKAMARTRDAYQRQVLKLLGILGKGPEAPPKPTAWGRVCPVSRLAPAWAAAQRELWSYTLLGQDLEVAYRFIARHEDLGATAGLLPNSRTQLAHAKKGFRTALADLGELRAEWLRGVVPELRLVNCNDKLLQAAVDDPEHYKVIEEDRPDAVPAQQPPRARPRATFYLDNTLCPDPVDVWIDGVPLGQVAPGRRSALIADGGERTLCLIVPGAAQCGDKGTVRQVYLHDGWGATMHCIKR